jgi:hypothetical protein
MATNDNRTAPPGAFDTVLSEIAAERERQIAKGYTAEYDDRLSASSLGRKAMDRIAGNVVVGDDRQGLIEAAALIVAQIQRLDRAKVGVL